MQITDDVAQLQEQLLRNEEVVKTLMARIDFYRNKLDDLEKENEWLLEEISDLYRTFRVIEQQHKHICNFLDIESKI